jgi:hypothetical protein
VSNLLTGLETTTSTDIKQCLYSIKGQLGHFFIELVCVGNCIPKKLLTDFESSSRFCSVKHCQSLNKGVRLCTYEMIFRMDSSGIIMPERIEKQWKFMREHPKSIMCGAQVQTVLRATDTVVNVTSYADLACTLPGLVSAASSTFCLRKFAVLALGNYDPTITDATAADNDLLKRVLAIRSTVHNMSDTVVSVRA